MDLHSYNWTSSEPASIESGEQSSIQYGIPRSCYCGLNHVLLTCNSGVNLVRRYYACKNREGGGCHIRKWWDELLGRFQENKMEKGSLEDRFRYINTGSEGTLVDPRVMWNNVLYSRDEVFRLHVLSKAIEAKIEELKAMVEELQSRDMSLEVERSAMAVKEMKSLTSIAVSVALVAFLILLFK